MRSLGETRYIVKVLKRYITPREHSKGGTAPPL
jgi:hypothetical protein